MIGDLVETEILTETLSVIEDLEIVVMTAETEESLLGIGIAETDTKIGIKL